jgi:hypothetical protein
MVLLCLFYVKYYLHRKYFKQITEINITSTTILFTTPALSEYVKHCASTGLKTSKIKFAPQPSTHIPASCKSCRNLIRSTYRNDSCKRINRHGFPPSVNSSDLMQITYKSLRGNAGLLQTQSGVRDLRFSRKLKQVTPCCLVENLPTLRRNLPSPLRVPSKRWYMYKDNTASHPT